MLDSRKRGDRMFAHLSEFTCGKFIYFPSELFHSAINNNCDEHLELDANGSANSKSGSD